MNNTRIQEVILAMSNRYVIDFGKLDDRFYFMSGFVSTVLKYINEPDFDKEWNADPQTEETGTITCK